MSQSEEIQAEFQRSKNALTAAEFLEGKVLLEDSLSRCYYSILHAAKAALLTLDIRVDSHEAVKRLFGKHFIQTNEIEKEYAVILREGQDDRLSADYDVLFTVDAQRIKKRIDDAKKFLEKMTVFIKQQGFHISS